MRSFLTALMLVSFLPGVVFGEKNVAVSPSVAGLSDVSAMAEATISSARDVEKADRADTERKLMDAWKGAADSSAIPMVGISFPVSHHDNGGVRLQFRAGEALLPSLNSDYLRAKDITLELFTPTGAMVGAFHGDRGLYDRAARVGFCEGPVLIVNKDVRIDGTNMIWDLESRNAKILKSARVVIRAGMMKGVGKSFQ